MREDVCAKANWRRWIDSFSLFFLSLSLQKWKPKGPALQHMVSGLCLDSQAPTGPPVITQCRPQMASQSWEPQVITWATADGGGGGGRRGADSGPGLQKDSGDHICTLSVAVLRDEQSENCTFVMSTSSSRSLFLGDKSVTDNILRPRRAKHLRSFVYSASSFEDAAVLLRNLSFSLKTVAHLTFQFLCLSLVNDLLQIGMVWAASEQMSAYCTVASVLRLTWPTLSQSRCLSCCLVLGWGMSDDGVDQGSFMYSQLKKNPSFLFFFIAE